MKMVHADNEDKAQKCRNVKKREGLCPSFFFVFECIR